MAVLRRGDTGAEISLDCTSLGWVIGQGCDRLAKGMLSDAARSRFVVKSGMPESLRRDARFACFAGLANRGPAHAHEDASLAQLLLMS